MSDDNILFDTKEACLVHEFNISTAEQITNYLQTINNSIIDDMTIDDINELSLMLVNNFKSIKDIIDGRQPYS